jgi:hypothetical protein
MEPLLPATEALFATQRQQQQHFVKTAEIQRTLRQTTVYALAALDKLAERGDTLEQQTTQAMEIEASSFAVAMEIQRENEGRTCWGWVKNIFCSPHRRREREANPSTINTKNRRVLYFAAAAGE